MAGLDSTILSFGGVRSGSCGGVVVVVGATALWCELLVGAGNEGAPGELLLRLAVVFVVELPQPASAISAKTPESLSRYRRTRRIVLWLPIGTDQETGVPGNPHCLLTQRSRVEVRLRGKALRERVEHE